jgi:DNA gyrase subunit A
MIDLIKSHIKHRRFVIGKRIELLLLKAEKRLRVVAAYLAALSHIDEVIDIVKTSQTTDIAKEKLKALLSIDDEQTEYILDIQIRQLTRMQASKLKDEEKELKASVSDYNDILSKPKRIDDIIIKEQADIKAVCDCKRYTTILSGEPKEFSSTDLIEEQKLSIMIGHDGSANIVKQFNDSLTSSETDRIAKVLDCSNLDYLMAVTKDGYCYVRPLHTMEIGTRRSHGSNILGVDNGKSIVDYLTIPNGAKDHYISLITSNSKIKTSPVEEFDLRNSREQEAIKLSDGAIVVGAVSHRVENNQFVIMSETGFATRYACENINPTGRKTQGVAGFSVTGGSPVSLMVANEDFAGHIFFITENGMGKKVPIDQVRISSGRASKGSNIGQIDKKTGRVIGAVLADKAEDISVVTTVGQVIFYDSDKIPEKTRHNRCETISKLAMGDKIQKVYKLW